MPSRYRRMAGEVAGLVVVASGVQDGEAAGAPPIAVVVDGSWACMEAGASCLEWLVLAVVVPVAVAPPELGEAVEVGRGTGSRREAAEEPGEAYMLGGSDREGTGGAER